MKEQMMDLVWAGVELNPCMNTIRIEDYDF